MQAEGPVHPGARVGHGPRAVRLSRRAWLAGAAGVATAGVGVIAGCGSTAARLLRAASSPVTLVWRPWYNLPQGRQRSIAAVMQQGIAPWVRAHPGVQVRITTLGYQQDTVAAILGGRGPDVFEDWVLPPYVQGGLLLDLSPYVRRDRVDLAAFAGTSLDYLTATGRYAPGSPGLFGLPAYTHTLALAVNQGILDEIGATYPEPDWTYVDWTRLWESATRRSSDRARQRYGGQIYWSGYDYTQGNPAPFYLRGFGGEYVDPADNTRCLLDARGSVDCLAWAYALLRDGVVGGDDGADFAAGRQTTAIVGTDGSLYHAAAAWQGLKWDIYPMPVWPRGRLTFASSDFYGVSAATAEPDLAWEFVKYLCVGRQWQRFMMKLLVAPNQLALLPEWAEVVRAVAPPLGGKALQVVVRAVSGGEAYVGASFRYEEEASAGVIARYSRLARAGEISVLDAARRAAAEVNALQAGGAAAQAVAFAEVQQIERIALSSLPIRLPPPPVAGAGAAPSRAPGALRAGSGGFTLLAGGSRFGGTGDDCTFLAAAATSSRGGFVCRLTAAGNVNCPRLDPWARFGLMARGDLSDDAPAFALSLTAAHGLWLQVRQAAGQDMAAYGPADTAEPAGLIGAPFLTRSLADWAPNYLLQPVWLKIVRDGVTWAAFSSLDGRTWSPAGPRQVVEMPGAWVGVFACAHNVDFGERFYVRASFDRLSWRPTAVYQVGRHGQAPGAGPIPPNWADG